MKQALSIFLIFSYCSVMYGQAGDNLFDDSFLHEIHFNNVDTSIFIGSKNYQMVNMVVDGTTLNSIGFKKKGNISAGHPNNKVPFKIKTNKYVMGQKHDGIKEFTLHNSYEDPTYMREKITYDICKDMGLHALRTAYAKVYIDGNYWGLYTIVEAKDQLFDLVFNNDDGDAIESLDFGDMCYLGNNPSDYDANSPGNLPYYQLENGNAATAWTNWVTMMDQANNTSDANYMSVVPQVLNLEHFFTYQALNVYLLNFDSYIGFKGNQIYYYDTTNTMWQVIPWDFNASLGLWNSNNHTPTSYQILPNAITNGCIAGKLQTVPALKNYYMDAMCRLNQVLLDTATINSRIDYLKAQIQVAVYSDWRKMFSNTNFDAALEYGYSSTILPGNNIPFLKTFFEARHTVISQDIVNENYTCPAVNTSVEKTQVDVEMVIYPNPATNGRITVEFGKTGDYTMTIYNALGQPVRNFALEQADQVAISGLESGIYYVNVSTREQQKSLTLIVH